MTKAETPSKALLDEIVRKIMEVSKPKRLILFGSAARGEMGPGSDLDLLVIVPDGAHRRRTAQTIYRKLADSAYPRGHCSGYGKRCAGSRSESLDGSDIRLFERGKNFIMPQDRQTPGSPQDWLARAKGDLALALAPLPEGAFYEDLCFHAQQAAEKAVKAVYQKHGLAFRYTHDLGELFARLKEEGFVIPPEVEYAQILVTYASEYRYPSLAEPVTAEEYREATKLAEIVVRWAEAIVTRNPV